MSSSSKSAWSPADNPYAIALSESQWWKSAVLLAAIRLRDPADRRIGPHSSRQIDARNLVIALNQLLVAAKLELKALEELDEQDIIDRLRSQRDQFLHVLPDVDSMRHALMHFDNWATGDGQGQQKRVRSGQTKRDAAREDWGFAYDPAAGTITMGSLVIGVDDAERAARDLAAAVYTASGEVDRLG